VRELLADDEQAQRLGDRVYVGGHHEPDVLIALVAAGDAPAEGTVELAPFLHAAITSQAVDRVVQTASGRARFFVGVMLWRPGELESEVASGAWHVVGLEPALVSRADDATLWGELVAHAEAGQTPAALASTVP
jgi:putative AlgH/UPF0301 family transcriptional regulator